MIDQISQKNGLVNQKTYSKQNTEKRIPSDENGFNKIKNNFEQPNIDVIGVSKGREAQKKIFQEIMSIISIYVDYFIGSTTKLIELSSI